MLGVSRVVDIKHITGTRALNYLKQDISMSDCINGCLPNESQKRGYPRLLNDCD